MKSAINHIRCQYISHTYHEKSNIEMAIKVLKEGIPWIQYRDKEVDDKTFLEQARSLVDTNSLYAGVIILNDRAHLVQKSGADGVHMGKTDGNIQEARTLIGGDKVLGFTINDDEDLSLFKKNKKYIDYLGIGPLHNTQTKSNAKSPLGTKGIQTLMTKVREIDPNIPVVVVGGVTLSDFPILSSLAVQGVAMSRFIHESSIADLLPKIHKHFD